MFAFLSKACRLCAWISLSLLISACAGGTSVESRKSISELGKDFDGFYLSYYLSKGHINASLTYTKSKGEFLLNIDETAKVKPDFDFKYHIVYSHHGLAHDVVTAETSNGLLKTVSSTTKDETVTFVENLNKVATQAGELIKAVQPTFIPPTDVPTQPPEECPGTAHKAVNIELTNWRGPEKPYLQKDAGNCVIEITKLSVGLFDRLDAAAFQPPENYTDTEISDPFDVCKSSVCFRLTGAYKVRIEADVRNVKTGQILGSVEKTVELLAPAPHKLGYVRFNRRAFVQNKTVMKFENGMLSSLEVDDPSEIVGFLLLPTEVLKFFTILITV